MLECLAHAFEGWFVNGFRNEFCKRVMGTKQWFVHDQFAVCCVGCLTAVHALWSSSAGRHFATKEMTGGMLDLHMTSGNEKFFIYAHFSLAHVL